MSCMLNVYRVKSTKLFFCFLKGDKSEKGQWLPSHSLFVLNITHKNTTLYQKAWIPCCNSATEDTQLHCGPLGWKTKVDKGRLHLSSSLNEIYKHVGILLFLSSQNQPTNPSLLPPSITYTRDTAIQPNLRHCVIGGMVNTIYIQSFEKQRNPLLAVPFYLTKSHDTSSFYC